MARPVLALGASALALTLAACGGSSGDGKGSVQERRAIGRKALLMRTDLPEGWREAPPESRQESKLDRRLASCLQAPAEELEGGAAEVSSPTFRRGESVIRSSVSVATTAAQAEARYSDYKQRRAGRCIGVAFAHALEEGATGLATGLTAGPVAAGHVTVRLLTVFSESDAAVGYRVVVPLTVAGRSLKVTGDAVVMRIGRATTDVLYSGEEAVGAATERRLNILVCQRLRAALAAH